MRCPECGAVMERTGVRQSFECDGCGMKVSESNLLRDQLMADDGQPLFDDPDEYIDGEETW